MADMRKRQNVAVGAPDVETSGGIMLGKPATEKSQFPTGVGDELSALAMKPVGFISEDGVTKTVDRESTEIRDWDGDDVVIIDSSHSVELKTTFLESTNLEVLKFVMGEENVQVENGKISVVENSKSLPQRSLQFIINGGQDTRIGVFAPNVKVTNVGDVQYVKTDVIKYEVTMKCFGVDGVKLKSIIERDGIQAESDAS